jgi:predicted MFS family arabinose efflux permease
MDHHRHGHQHGTAKEGVLMNRESSSAGASDVTTPSVRPGEFTVVTGMPVLKYDSAASASNPALQRRDAIVALVLLTLASLVNYIDRMLLPVLAQPIKLEFGLSDTEVGVLTGFSFALVYALAGIPIARAADRGVRRTILAVALAFWSLMTAACGLARSYWHLALARVGVGIGESGCTPSSYSLLSDYFPPERRGTAIAWFVMGNCLGITIGFALGGWLGAHIGWRNAFLVVGLPGVLLAIAIRVFVREPPRGVEAGSAAPLSTAQTARLLFHNRSYRWALAGNAAYTYLIYGPVAWLPAFFMRTHDLSLQVAGTWSGIVIGVGMAIGTLTGGFWGDRLTRGGLERPQFLCMGAAVALAFGYAVAFWAPSAPLAFTAAFVACAIGGLAASPNPTTILNVSEPRVRATAAAVNVMVCSLFGIGLAPVLIGLMSDAFTPAAGPRALRYALTVSLGACFIAAAIHRRTATLMSEEGFASRVRGPHSRPAVSSR